MHRSPDARGICVAQAPVRLFRERVRKRSPVPKPAYAKPLPQGAMSGRMTAGGFPQGRIVYGGNLRMEPQDRVRIIRKNETVAVTVSFHFVGAEGFEPPTLCL